MPNPVVHFEICSANSAKATEFYKSIFDWDIKAEPGMDYSLIKTGAEPDGGIFTLEGDMKPYITIYVKVEDIDGTLDEAEKLGAFIIQRKKQISAEHGYYGMFADPDGNVVGLWSKE